MHQASIKLSHEIDQSNRLVTVNFLKWNKRILMELELIQTSSSGQGNQTGYAKTKIRGAEED